MEDCTSGQEENPSMNVADFTSAPTSTSSTSASQEQQVQQQESQSESNSQSDIQQHHHKKQQDLRHNSISNSTTPPTSTSVVSRFLEGPFEQREKNKRRRSSLARLDRDRREREKVSNSGTTTANYNDETTFSDLNLNLNSCYQETFVSGNSTITTTSLTSSDNDFSQKANISKENNTTTLENSKPSSASLSPTNTGVMGGEGIVEQYKHNNNNNNNTEYNNTGGGEVKKIDEDNDNNTQPQIQNKKYRQEQQDDFEELFEPLLPKSGKENVENRDHHTQIPNDPPSATSNELRYRFNDKIDKPLTKSSYQHSTIETSSHNFDDDESVAWRSYEKERRKGHIFGYRTGRERAALRWMLTLLVAFVVQGIAVAMMFGTSLLVSWRKKFTLFTLNHIYLQINNIYDPDYKENSNANDIDPTNNDIDSQSYFSQGQIWKLFLLPFLVFLAFSLLFVSIAFFMCYLEPSAIGSGLPEAKTYLNGITLPRIFRVRTLLSKGLGIMCSVAAGLPAGKEGPLIHIGSIVGAILSQGKTIFRLFGQEWYFLRNDDFRTNKEKRDFVACGAAAGVTAAFGAPLGGMLFAMEEGASYWSVKLSWRVFFCCVSTSLVGIFFNTYFFQKEGAAELSYFGYFPESLVGMPSTASTSEGIKYPWKFVDLLLFFALGIFGGLVGALFNQMNLMLTKWRKKNVKSLVMKYFEVLLVATIMAILSYGIPIIYGLSSSGYVVPSTLYFKGNKLTTSSSQEQYCKYILPEEQEKELGGNINSLFVQIPFTSCSEQFNNAIETSEDSSPLNPISTSNCLNHTFNSMASLYFNKWDDSLRLLFHAPMYTTYYLPGENPSEASVSPLNISPESYYTETKEIQYGEVRRRERHVDEYEDYPKQQGEKEEKEQTKVTIFSITELIVFVLPYFIMTFVTFGTMVPSGLFIPSLVSGAAFGRIVGQLLHEASNGNNFADPGVYSLMGASAMLGGITRIYISLSVILLETTGNLYFLFPFMVVLMTARFIGNAFNDGIYDLHIHLRNYPFLEAWCPMETKLHDVSASDIMASPVITLRPVEQISHIMDVLKSNEHHAYPLIDETNGDIYGIIERNVLCTLLYMIDENRNERMQTGTDKGVERKSEYSYNRIPSINININQPQKITEDLENRLPNYFDGLLLMNDSIPYEDIIQFYPNYPKLEDLLHLNIQYSDQYVDLRNYCNKAPYIINECCSVSRLYRLFRTMGMRHLLVVERQKHSKYANEDDKRYTNSTELSWIIPSQRSENKSFENPLITGDTRLKGDENQDIMEVSDKSCNDKRKVGSMNRNTNGSCRLAGIITRHDLMASHFEHICREKRIQIGRRRESRTYTF